MASEQHDPSQQIIETPRKRRRIDIENLVSPIDGAEIIEVPEQSSSQSPSRSQDKPPINKGKGKARAWVEREDIDVVVVNDSDDDDTYMKPSNILKHDTSPPITAPIIDTLPKISQYNCPICLCPPTAAVVTLCGHIFCGSCLFSSLETSEARARNLGLGGDALIPKCPFCRAQIEGWDGQGGGVIGLIPKVAKMI